MDLPHVSSFGVYSFEKALLKIENTVFFLLINYDIHTFKQTHSHRRAHTQTRTHAHTDTLSQKHIHKEQAKLLVKSKVPPNSKGLQFNRLTQRG